MKRIKNLYSNILSPDIVDSNLHRNLFYRYLSLGILIRFLLMPFFFMEGLLYTYRRSAILLFNPDTGLNIEQLVLESFQTVYLFVINNIFPYFEDIKNILLYEDPFLSWYDFSTDEYILRTLFIFKFLYFIFDMIGAFLIIRFFKDKDDKIRVFKYWMFNPVIIFVVYFIGRLDIIPVVFLVLAFYLVKINKKTIAFFIFILTIFMRFFPVLVLPLFIGYISKKKRDFIIYWSISLSIFAIIEIISKLVFNKSLFMTIIDSYHFRFLLTRSIGIFTYDKIIIFIISYLLILFFYFRSKEKEFILFIKYCSLVYLVFFAFSVFYPQYFLWIIPFLIFIFILDKRLIVLHAVQFIFLLLLIPYWWKWPYSNELFVSIDHDVFVGLPNLAEITAVFYPASNSQLILRIIFSGLTLSMAALIITSITKMNKIKNERL